MVDAVLVELERFVEAAERSGSPAAGALRAALRAAQLKSSSAVVPRPRPADIPRTTATTDD